MVREMEKDEPLLQENPRRFVMFPIQYSDIWEFYKKAVGECLPFLPTRPAGGTAPFIFGAKFLAERANITAKYMNNSPAIQRPCWFICLCSVVLDGGGGRPVQGLGRLGATQVSRTTLHQTRPRLLRRQRRHRQREPGNTQ